MWKAERMLNVLFSGTNTERALIELKLLLKSPMTYTSELFDDEFLLDTRVKQPLDSVPDPSSQCCCFIFDHKSRISVRCRNETAPYNRFCKGHFNELKRDQHRLKNIIGPKAVTTKIPEDLYAFALLRLLIIKKFFQPGGPCEKALQGHINAIFKIGEEIQLDAIHAKEMEESEDEVIEEIVQLNIGSSSKTPSKLQNQHTFQDIAILMSRIIHNIPVFESLDDVPVFNFDMLSNPQPNWHLFTCRETSYYFDKDVKKNNVTVYTHAVSFLVIDFPTFVLIVCLNREERHVPSKTKTRAWGIFVPVVETLADMQIVSLSGDSKSVVSAPVADIACLGSVFKFSKDSDGLTRYHKQMSCLLEAHMQPQSMDRIVSRYPIEYLSGQGISVSLSKVRPKFQNFGMPANRLPRTQWISEITRANSPIQVLGIDIQFWGSGSPLISRDWHPPKESKERIKMWSEVSKLALNMHGELGKQLLADAKK